MAIDVKKMGGQGRGDFMWFAPDDLVIADDPDHPLYDERVRLEVKRALVDNIKFHGVIEPVIVRYNTTTGKTEVVDGRQRVKAARIARAEQKAAGEVEVRVPAIFRKEDDLRVMGIMVSANEQRTEDNVVTKARKAERMAALGASTEERCIAFGVTPQTLGNWRKILALPADLLAKVEAGEIAATDAIGRVKEARKAAKEPSKSAAFDVDAGEEVEISTAPRERQRRLRTRKEIEAAVKAHEAEDTAEGRSWAAALKWVLGKD